MAMVVVCRGLPRHISYTIKAFQMFLRMGFGYLGPGLYGIYCGAQHAGLSASGRIDLEAAVGLVNLAS